MVTSARASKSLPPIANARSSHSTASLRPVQVQYGHKPLSNCRAASPSPSVNALATAVRRFSSSVATRRLHIAVTNLEARHPPASRQ